MPYGDRINIGDATPKGTHVVISSLVDEAKDVSPKFMMTKLGKRYLMAANLFIVPTDAILGTAFVIEEETFPSTKLPKTVVSYAHITKWGNFFLPDDWNHDEESVSFTKPDVSDDANTLTTDAIMEENRSSIIQQSFDGFVVDYTEDV